MSHSTHLPSDPEVYAGHGFPKKPDTIQASPQQAPQNTSKNRCFLVREDFMGKSIRFFEVPLKALMAVAAAIAFLGLPPSSSAHVGFPHCLRHPPGRPFECLRPGGSMNPGGITGLTFCNKSSYSNIKVAYGATDFENDWYSKGYWTLARGECSKVLTGSLNNRYYYAYAWVGSASNPSVYWGGGHNSGKFCIGRNSPFQIWNKHNSCTSEGYIRNFSRIDTGSVATGHTYNFR